MPVMDSDFMLRDGSTNLDGTEDGDGVHVGKCPLNGMLLEIYLPTDATTVTIKLQESSDDGDSDAYADVEGMSWTFTVGAKTYYKRVFWDEAYVRHTVSACTGDWGAAQIGFIQGGEPKDS